MEIHPLVVAVGEQGKGYGLAKQQGVLGLFASTGDETGATNLYGIDLYQNPLAALV